jgi:protoporphyrinogen oxidase
MGGIGTIAGRLARAVEQHGGTIALHTQVTGLDTHADRVVAVRWQDQSSGRHGRSDVDGVISTIPLPHLARMCPQTHRLSQAIAGLRYRSMVLVHLLIKRDWVTGDHWLYVPEPQYLFNRLNEPKRFSAQMAPPGYTSLCAEITCDVEDDLWHADPDQLIARVTSSLHRLNLLHPSEVCGGFVTREPQEYPIYTLAYRQHREAILTHLRRLTNLHTTGRQGLFQYTNMDQAMEMGLAAADAVLAQQAPSAYTLRRLEV